MQFRQVSSIFLGLLYSVSGTPLGQIVESRQLLPTIAVNLNFTHITGHFTPLSAITNTLNVDFDISPIIPLDVLDRLVTISITNMTLSAGIFGTEYISFTHAFDTPLAVPLSGSVNSGTISGVSLTQGALATVLNALPAHTLDIFSAGVNMEVTLITRPFTSPLFLPLTQSNVDTTWSLI
ncbi:hypothetical protein CCMSSC00406_0010146 [Pleurotus cornucopiae]|uniref:Uncharacterized protein n=1 Tax=Pleurotus cornucopiae TaxID=5321 RepID=A0ACB7IU03_PLECO|nr:hypothetical protein CCMSSC00406_0010146 [Pleurotus cornucopiae]